MVHPKWWVRRPGEVRVHLDEMDEVDDESEPEASGCDVAVAVEGRKHRKNGGFTRGNHKKTIGKS
jgi:hypothetical protein